MPTWRELPTQACETSAADTVMEYTMHEARIELLQRMPVFGGIRTEVLQFLLGFCPIVSVPANDFFFREREPPY